MEKINSVPETVALPRLPRRSPDAHKNSVGSVLVVAGSVGYTGAAYLAAKAALRAGAGVVVTACPDAVQPILAAKHTCVMVRPFPSTKTGSLSRKARKAIVELARGFSALALGPGLGRAESTAELAREVVLAHEGKLVLDADGLNAFVGHAELLESLRGEAVLTPHPGELARLTGKTTSEIQGDREGMARRFAEDLRGVLVLKGRATLVAQSVEGTVRLHTNRSGNEGLATAGSGDVLTGITASLLAQGLSAWDAARLAVHVHGRAADLARERLGAGLPVPLIATDVLDSIPAALAERLALEAQP
jgi:NAD(P)H-hydrate epimerase